MEHKIPDQMRELMVYWIHERYSILKKRKEGRPKPWSPDTIFQSVRFCNVHREDDVVTQWIRQNWNMPTDPAWKFVLGRMINWVPSLDSMRPWNSPENMKSVLEDKRRDGHKIFTSVYTISTCGRKMDKLDYVFDHVIKQLVDRQEEFDWHPIGAPLLFNMFDLLRTVDGLGSFLAGQVIADMKNTNGHFLHRAVDWWTWSCSGPGSLRGLAWLYGVPSVSEGQYDALIHVAMRDILADERLLHIPRISAQDFQNCLCEFSKYCKVRYAGGHVRNRYNGR